MAAPPVQREVAIGEIESQPAPEESAGSQPDIDELSEKVWRKLEDRIRIEKERQFGLP